MNNEETKNRRGRRPTVEPRRGYGKHKQKKHLTKRKGPFIMMPTLLALDKRWLAIGSDQGNKLIY